MGNDVATRFKPGQPRPANAGRKKGTPNKKAVEFQKLLDEKNFSPGEELIFIYTEAKAIYKSYRKKKMLSSAMETLDSMSSTADKICQYVYPKKKAVEHTGQLEVKTFADFIAASEPDGDDDNDDDID